MAYTPLPAAPARADAANFAARADAFLPALAPFGVEMNANGDRAEAGAIRAEAAAVAAVNAPGTQATSATSIAVATGARSFAIQTGKAIIPGMWLTIAPPAAPGVWMSAVVTSYNPATGALVVDVRFLAGSGTYSDWTLVLSPPVAFKAATKEQIWEGVTDGVAYTPAGVLSAVAPVIIPYAPTLILNGNTFINATIELTGNISLPNPINMKPGRGGFITIKTNGFTWSLGTAWDFVGNIVPSLSASGSLDELVYQPKGGDVISSALRKAVGG